MIPTEVEESTHRLLNRIEGLHQKSLELHDRSFANDSPL
ncbi:hypothetical protein AHF37_06833 [Paragonimus kellicotti]|nr:hypothetical protein AHF37_06833 [Paragonimus kellicotti]